GTPGQKKIPETQLPNALVIPDRKTQLPSTLGRYKQIILEKHELDVFSNPNSETLLGKFPGLREIVLYGVVTEICVAYAARGLASRGYRPRIVMDAIRHLDEAKARAFLEELSKSGELVTTEDLIAALALSA